MTPNQKKLETYREANLEAARIILEDVERYGGEEALVVLWARLVLKPEPRRPLNGA